MFMDAIPAVLEKGSLSEQELTAIESALAQADPSEGMERLWIAERVYCLELWRNLIRPPRRLLPDDATRLPEAAPRGLLASPVFRLMIAYKLRTDARYTEAARKGWPGALEAAQDISRSDLGVFGFFSRLLIPSYEQVFVHFGRAIGSVRSAQVAVMVERYRLAKGHLPESLRELRSFVGRDLPADPFTGKDLIYKIYKVQGEGFLVYSLGENKADDGGPSPGPDKKDWGLAVRRAPK